MAEYGSSQYSSETNDDYDLSLSTSLSSKASKEIYLSALLQKWKCSLTALSLSYHLLPCLLLIVILMMEFTALLFLSLHLLSVWKMLTGKFVYKKVAFIAHKTQIITELFYNIKHCVLVIGVCVVAVTWADCQHVHHHQLSMESRQPYIVLTMLIALSLY